MNLNFKKLSLVIFALCLLPTVFGCAPVTYRAHPELEMLSKNIKTLGFTSPDIKIYEFTAGGIRELRDDWCLKGRQNVQWAFMDCLNDKSLKMKPILKDKASEEEMEDIYALYRAVSASIFLHTYGDFKFPEKQKNFDYSIGSIENILKKHEVDTLIIISGYDEIATSGRKALTVAGMVAGAVTGVMIVPRAGITALTVALIDPSGAILWHNAKASQGGHDLRNAESANALVKDILSSFPRLGK
jgi:hypothetical protein